MIRKIVDMLPNNGRQVKDFYWKQKFNINKLKTKLFSNSELNIDTEHIYWVNPEKIVFHTNLFNGDESIPVRDRIFNTINDTGKAFDGDWDLSEYRFEDLEVYRAFHSRIKENASWEDTDFYKRVLKDINSGRKQWDCTSKEELDKRMDYLDSLIESISKNGYKLSSEIQIEKDKGLFAQKEEVLVNIGRNGQLLFQNGRHRLSIAKILKIDSIPIKICVRHKSWIEYLNVINNYIPENGNYLYQPTLHPELDYLFSIKHKCEDRFHAMIDNMPENSTPGRFLDIGANTGYFCHEFSQKGYDCTAVENHPTILFILEKLMAYHDDEFEIFDKSIFEYVNVKSEKFEIVIALNIFHHFLKTEYYYDKLVDFLNKLDTNLMFFEPHLYDEKQMESAYKNLDNMEFVNFVIDNTSLTSYKKIYQAEDNRTLYLLFKE